MTAWKRSWLKSLRKYWPMYLMLVPVIAYFLVFKYKPMLFVQIAFKDYKLRKGIWASEWVGLKHFMRFFSSYNFKTTLVNTAVLSGLSLLCCFPFPIFLALLFNELRTDRGKKLVRTITYAPHFISTIVMVGMMIAICSPSTGIVNKILIALGVTQDGLYLMGSGKYFRMMYILSDIWKNSGWNAIIFISAISAIETTLYEAARVDGASRWQQLIYITLPSILPTIVIMLILRCGSILGVGHEKVYAMQTDLNLGVSEVISTYSYKIGLIDMRYDYATAIDLFNAVINLTMLLIVNAISRKVTETSLW
ncbi:MAG: ABC transporter permease [Aristaeellaceae bacterium]